MKKDEIVPRKARNLRRQDYGSESYEIGGLTHRHIKLDTEKYFSDLLDSSSDGSAIIAGNTSNLEDEVRIIWSFASTIYEIEKLPNGYRHFCYNYKNNNDFENFYTEAADKKIREFPETYKFITAIEIPELFGFTNQDAVWLAKELFELAEELLIRNKQLDSPITRAQIYRIGLEVQNCMRSLDNEYGDRADGKSSELLLAEMLLEKAKKKSGADQTNKEKKKISVQRENKIYETAVKLMKQNHYSSNSSLVQRIVEELEGDTYKAKKTKVFELLKKLGGIGAIRDGIKASYKNKLHPPR